MFWIYFLGLFIIEIGAAIVSGVCMWMVITLEFGNSMSGAWGWPSVRPPTRWFVLIAFILLTGLALGGAGLACWLL